MKLKHYLQRYLVVQIAYEVFRVIIMKKKQKYEIINHGIKEYSKIFDRNYKRVNISKKTLEGLLNKHKHSHMTKWCYCCRGLYDCCWQDPYFEGCWDMTQKRVDEIILSTIRNLHKYYRRDNRIGMYEKDGEIGIVIIARDLPRFAADYFIGFSNKEIE